MTFLLMYDPLDITWKPPKNYIHASPYLRVSGFEGKCFTLDLNGGYKVEICSHNIWWLGLNIQILILKSAKIAWKFNGATD